MVSPRRSTSPRKTPTRTRSSSRVPSTRKRSKTTKKKSKSRPKREYTYHVDIDGTLWHDGWPTDADALYQAFFETLEETPDGRLRATCQGETCWIVPADTPFVVDSIEDSEEQILLVFTGGVREVLDLTKLFVGAHNVLYARVRRGDFCARFSRKAYYQLAVHTVEYEDGFAVLLGGKHHPIKGSDRT